MGDLLRVVGFMSMALALVASASAPKQHKVAKAMETGASFDQTWAAMIEVFADRNWTIENMEKESGLIATDWMNLDEGNRYADCGESGIARTHGQQIRFNVFVRAGDNGTELTVNARFRELRSFDGREHMADSAHPPDGWRR